MAKRTRLIPRNEVLAYDITRLTAWVTARPSEAADLIYALARRRVTLPSPPAPPEPPVGYNRVIGTAVFFGRG
jgi:hypothetical protein